MPFANCATKSSKSAIVAGAVPVGSVSAWNMPIRFGALPFSVNHLGVEFVTQHKAGVLPQHRLEILLPHLRDIFQGQIPVVR